MLPNPELQRAQSRRAAISASLTYALLLAGPGVFLPFFPLWLANRGLSPSEIGLALAIPMIMRVIASAPFARIGDGRLGPRRTFLLMVCATALGYGALALAQGFWPIAALLVVTSAFLAPTIPLLDVIVLQGVTLHGHDYGRIRQWGSLAWLAASVAAGFLLVHLPVDAVPPILALLSALTVFAGLSLPDDRRIVSAPPAEKASSADPRPALLLLICASLACLQGAHAFLYGFATLIFERNGFTSAEIGLLWAVGVVLETALFLFAGNIAGWLGPYRLIGLGAVAGIVRWFLMGLDPASGLATAGLQAIHGLTFAAVHLGTMGWLSRFASRRAERQGIVASSIGVGLAAGAVAAGPLYGALGAQGYFVMAGISAAGLCLVLAARRLEARYPQRSGSDG
jgi:MFS transporter, PPP family, 3-phenylpropionic acid transporter